VAMLRAATLRWSAMRLAPNRIVRQVIVATSAAATSAAAYCAAAPSWKLQYFPVPGAPGEMVRLMLALRGDDWVDERTPGSKWAAMKPTSKFGGGMPILTGSDGQVMTQSKAIANYLASDLTVQGKPVLPEDPWLAFQVDEFIEVMEDVRGLISKTFAIKDQKEKEAARAAMFATDGSGVIFERLKRIEALTPTGGHMVGNSFTLADAWAFVTVNQLRSGFLDGIPADGWMEKLPKLRAVVQSVAEIPQVKAHYKKHSQMVVMGNQIYAPHAGLK